MVIRSEPRAARCGVAVAGPRTPPGADRMTTLRQTLANRRNARHSTGPRSPEGRQAAARNALTHGLSADEARHEDEESLIAERLEEWLRDLRPVGAVQRWLAERVVAASAR